MNALISFALRQRILVAIIFVAMLAAGAVAFLKLNIEAYPDPVPPLVDIVTQTTGQSAEEIERYITIPTEIQLAGIPHRHSDAHISLFGLSDIELQFTYDFSYDEAEQRVINRLTQLEPCPTTPSRRSLRRARSAKSTAIGCRPAWIFGHGPQDRAGLDASAAFQGRARRHRRQRLGGKTKTYRRKHRYGQAVDYGLTLPQVLQALNNSNLNVGGQTVNIGPSRRSSAASA